MVNVRVRLYVYPIYRMEIYSVYSTIPGLTLYDAIAILTSSCYNLKTIYLRIEKGLIIFFTSTLTLLLFYCLTHGVKKVKS